jgi:hypothetical protein
MGALAGFAVIASPVIALEEPLQVENTAGSASAALVPRTD